MRTSKSKVKLTLRCEVGTFASVIFLSIWRHFWSFLITYGENCFFFTILYAMEYWNLVKMIKNLFFGMKITKMWFTMKKLLKWHDLGLKCISMEMYSIEKKNKWLFSMEIWSHEQTVSHIFNTVKEKLLKNGEINLMETNSMTG